MDRRGVGRDLGTELALSLPMSDLVTLDDLDPRGLDVAVLSGGARVSGQEAERPAGPNTPWSRAPTSQGLSGDFPQAGKAPTAPKETNALVRARFPSTR